MTEEVAAVQVRLDATAARFENQVKRAERAFSRSAGNIDRRVERTNRRLNNMGKGMSGLMRSRVSNVGNQLQDVLVQAQMGTDAFRILGQQGPQLASAFGPAGAIIGTLVAGLAILGPSLFDTEKKVATLSDALDALGLAHQQIGVSQDLLKLSLDEVRAKYGENVEAINRLRIAFAELTLAEVRRSFDQLGASAETALAKITTFTNANLIGDHAERAAIAFAQRMDQLAGMLGITALEATRLNATFVELGTSKTLEDKSAALDRMTQLMDELGVSLSDFPPEIQKALRELIEVNLNFMAADQSARDLAGSIAAGADEAGRLTVETDRAAAAAAAAAANFDAMFAARSFLLSRRFAAEDSLMGLPLKATPLPENKLPGYVKPTRRRGGGGGGGRARQDTTGERLIGRMEDRLRKLTEEARLVGLSEEAHARLSAQFEREKLVRELLAAAAREGATIGEAEKARAVELAEAIEAQTLAIFAKEQAVKRAAEAAREAADREKEMAEGIAEVGNQLISAVQDADSFTDALRRVGLMMLDLAAKGLFGQGPLGSLFNAGFGVKSGGILGSLIGSAAGGGGGHWTGLPGFAKGAAFSGGNVTAFANGGVVSGPTAFPMPRGVGLVGEAGPEGILPLKRSASGRLGVEASGMGGQSITVAPSYHISGVGASASEIGGMIEANNRRLPGMLREALRRGK